MVFLIAYGIFEVPSNYLLKKLRPSVRLPHLSIRAAKPKCRGITDTNSDGLHF